MEENSVKSSLDLDSKDLMTDNIVSYEGNPYKVMCVTDSLLYLDPFNKKDPQIKCYIYQAKAMPASEIYDQLPIPMNDIPSYYACVHEIQNWYYWNNGKRRLDLKIKTK